MAYLADTGEEYHEGDWVAAEFWCEKCGASNAVVYPDCCDELECDKCGHYSAAPHLINN